MADLIKILSWFKKGANPTEDQFKQSWTSFWHKSERLPITQVLGLNDSLKDKATKEDLNNIASGFNPLGTKANKAEIEALNSSKKGDTWKAADTNIWWKHNGDNDQPYDGSKWVQIDYLPTDVATKPEVDIKADKSQLSELFGALTYGYDKFLSINNTGDNVYANSFYSAEILGIKIKVHKPLNTSKITVSILDVEAKIVTRKIADYNLSAYTDKEVIDIFFSDVVKLQPNERMAISGYVYFDNFDSYSDGGYNIENGVFGFFPKLLLAYKLLIPLDVKTTISNVDKLKDSTNVFGASEIDYNKLGQKKTAPNTDLYANDFYIKRVQGIQYKVASGSPTLSVEKVNKYTMSTEVIQVFDLSAYSDKQIVNLYFDTPIDLLENELIGIRGLCYFDSFADYNGGSFYIEGAKKGFYSHLIIGYKLLTDKIDQKADIYTVEQINSRVEKVKSDNLVNYPMFKSNFKTTPNLNDFTNTANWALNDGLRCISASFSNYILHNKKITVEQRVTRVFATLYADSNFALIWKPVNGWMGGGSIFRVDAANSKMHIHNYWDGSNTLPSSKVSTDITIVSGREYILEAVKDFRINTFTIIDTITGQKVSIQSQPQPSINGATANFFAGGRQNNQFGFSLISGQSPIISNLSITAKAVQNPLLYIIGDSITEGDGVEENQRYARLISNMVAGSCIISGMSGTQIGTVIERLTVELPIFKPKYVMVTIGTNGGNTASNLAQLVALIEANGAIPIVNRIAMMPTNTQVINNQIANLGVLSCRFDLATAINNDPSQGQNVNLFKSDMLHPNYLGHEAMANRLVIDVPELLEIAM